MAKVGPISGAISVRPHSYNKPMIIKLADSMLKGKHICFFPFVDAGNRFGLWIVHVLDLPVYLVDRLLPFYATVGGTKQMVTQVDLDGPEAKMPQQYKWALAAMDHSNVPGPPSLPFRATETHPLNHFITLRHPDDTPPDQRYMLCVVAKKNSTHQESSVRLETFTGGSCTGLCARFT